MPINPLSANLIAPLPVQDPVAKSPRYKDDEMAGYMTDSWTAYMSQLVTTLQNTPVRIYEKGFLDQTGAIAVTSIAPGGVTAGVYRITYYTRLTTAAGTSSSLQVAFDWSDHAHTLAWTSPALTSNNVSVPMMGVLPIYSDSLSPITMAVTFSSVGSPAAIYEIYVSLEKSAVA